MGAVMMFKSGAMLIMNVSTDVSGRPAEERYRAKYGAEKKIDVKKIDVFSSIEC